MPIRRRRSGRSAGHCAKRVCCPWFCASRLIQVMCRSFWRGRWRFFRMSVRFCAGTAYLTSYRGLPVWRKHPAALLRIRCGREERRCRSMTGRSFCCRSFGTTGFRRSLKRRKNIFLWMCLPWRMRLPAPSGSWQNSVESQVWYWSGMGRGITGCFLRAPVWPFLTGFPGRIQRGMWERSGCPPA